MTTRNAEDGQPVQVWTRRTDPSRCTTMEGIGQAPVSPLTWRAWAQEIEAVWDRRFYFHRVDCKREHRCDCILMGCCKYPLRIFAKQGAAHGEVDLFEGAPLAKNRGKRDLGWYSHTWWTEIGEANRYVRAHEFGHLIGYHDEYAGGACQIGGHWVGAPNSIMNDGRTVFPRHVETFRKMFSAASPVVGAVRTIRA